MPSDALTANDPSVLLQPLAARHLAVVTPVAAKMMMANPLVTMSEAIDTAWVQVRKFRSQQHRKPFLSILSNTTIWSPQVFLPKPIISLEASLEQTPLAHYPKPHAQPSGSSKVLYHLALIPHAQPPLIDRMR
jgi:hypothetical protein